MPSCRLARCSVLWGTLLAVWFAWPLTASAAESPVAANAVAAADRVFCVPAVCYDRGNARVFTDQWADAEPMIAFGGE